MKNMKISNKNSDDAAQEYSNTSSDDAVQELNYTNSDDRVQENPAEFAGVTPDKKIMPMMM